MRVAIFGASGKVGREVLKNLLMQNTASDLELILLGRNTNKIKGLVADIESAISLLDDSSRTVPISVTNDPKDIEGADLVIMAAAVWPTEEQKAEFSKADPSGRLVQAYVNFELVQDIARQIAQYAPTATTIVVTNQSDLMAEAAREILPPEKVLGFGGMIDSARFHHLVHKLFPELTDQVKDIHMIGYHNSGMIPAMGNLPEKLKNHPSLQKIIAETRAYGGSVSKLQKDFNFPEIDTGASVLPGYALYKTISAWAHGDGMTASFNVRLPKDIADGYGVPSGSALSVPIEIKDGKYKVCIPRIDPSQAQHLQEAQRHLQATAAELQTFAKNKKNAPPAKRRGPSSGMSK